MIELDILNLFLKDKSNYDKYYNYIDNNYLKLNYSLIYKLYNIINIYYNKYTDKDSMSFEDLESLYVINYPFIKDVQREELALVMARLRSSNPNEEVILDLLKSHKIRAKANEIAAVAISVAEGRAEAEDLIREIESLQEDEQTEVVETFVTSNLEELYEKHVKENGLRWRLEYLNQSLGSLRPGDFGFIFARPETGKTTFLASEITHMAGQADGPILWINNEEQGGKVMLRCYQAALGCTVSKLFEDRADSELKYKEITSDRIKIIDEPSITKERVESLCKVHKPSLVIFDQIDKLEGFKGDRRDLELGAIYKWARDLAKKYCPVVGVCQADGTGEGQKWLTMSNVADAKTSKQAEADWILGIGKSHDTGLTNIRFFNISKNKLLGDEDTRPELRHSQREVVIEPEIARYRDINSRRIR